MTRPLHFFILAIAVYFGWQAFRPDNFKIENKTVNGDTNERAGIKTLPSLSRPVDRLLNIYRVVPGVKFEIVLAAFRYGAKYDIEAELLLCIAFVESSFRADASNDHCVGLYQVRPGIWAKHFGLDRSRLSEIDYNTKAAAMILRYYIDLAGDTWRGVHFYNNGPSGKYNNRRYVLKVRKLYNRLSAGGGLNEKVKP
jgi:hypothetical protein